MKQILYFFIAMGFLFDAVSAAAQTNIFVAPDSIYVSQPADEFEIDLPTQMTNNSGGTVTIRWTRVVEQKPQEWDVNFCDNNLCYLGIVASKTFDLANGESGLLKPIFYPHEVLGVGVFRLYLQSETAGVVWADTAVFVGVATELVGTVRAELVRDVAVFPNPTTEVLNIVTADPNFQGIWSITDLTGKQWSCSGEVGSAIAGQISVASLPSGIYFFNVLTAEGRQSTAKRFVVRR